MFVCSVSVHCPTDGQTEINRTHAGVRIWLPGQYRAVLHNAHC